MSAGADVGAQAALLLSHWWSRPTEGERELWPESFQIGEALAGELSCEPELVRALADAFELIDGDAMLDEYERLFVGPGAPPCQPYESLWLSGPRRRDAGSVMGPAAIAVSSIYKQLGLTLETDGNELPDHVMIEWEALAFALDRRDGEASESLLQDHLRKWMGPFCQAVAESAGEPFYTQLAALTPAWTAALAG
jgi:putative dimethyl sulfoxide reductase chaperone